MHNVMFNFFCGKCETWHGRFDDDVWDDRFEIGDDRLVTWRESIPDVLIIMDGDRCLVVDTDTIF